MATEVKDMVEIPRWQLKQIEDALRIASNILDSNSKKTSADRDIVQARKFAKNALEGNSDEIVSRF